jgi:sugar phosphate isomerase/epimerase
MYVSMNGTLVAGGKVPWPDFARLAAKTGFKGTDVNISAAIKEGADATERLLSDLHIAPAVVGLPVEFRKDEETFQRDLKGLDAAAQFAAAINCPRMTAYFLPSSELPKPEQRRIYKARWTACAGILAKHNVRFGLEFVSPVHLRKRFPHEFIYRMDETLELAKECGPNVGVLLDSWHWYHAGATLKDIESAGLNRIVHVQVADSPQLPPERIMDNERLMPGEGVIDLAGFFRTLKKIGYKDGVSPEIFGRGLKNMAPEEGAKLGLETTASVMRKAGAL